MTRRHRDGSLPPAGYARACRQFEKDWTTFVRTELDADTFQPARLVIQRHALRGFDGIHLASALRLQAETGESITLAAADDRLLQAARGEGLAILNVETG